MGKNPESKETIEDRVEELEKKVWDVFFLSVLAIVTGITSMLFQTYGGG